MRDHDAADFALIESSVMRGRNSSMHSTVNTQVFNGYVVHKLDQQSSPVYKQRMQLRLHTRKAYKSTGYIFISEYVKLQC